MVVMVAVEFWIAFVGVKMEESFVNCMLHS
jgi:hypothetical protein